jgi:4-diphosphocytidyl-2C-methyl-D-erythritol kinase
MPQVALSTVEVYRRFDELGLGRKLELDDEPDWSDWSKLDSIELLPRLVNDLEPAAFCLRPDLSELREGIEQVLGRPVRMSGSGSSLFTLYDVAEAASTAARCVKEQSHGERFRVRAIETRLAPPIVDDLSGDDRNGQ